MLALARRGRRIRIAALVATFVVLGGIAAGASIAYVRVSAAEQAANDAAERAKAALAQQIAEETARKRAEDARTAALASLLTEEQLRKAAEQGLLTAEQLAQIEAAKRRVAEHGEAVAEAQNAKLAGQLQLTREQLLDKNQQLEAALAEAKRASALAETAKAEALAAQTKLKDALSREQAHVQQLELEKKKMTTELK